MLKRMQQGCFHLGLIQTVLGFRQMAKLQLHNQQMDCPFCYLLIKIVWVTGWILLLVLNLHLLTSLAEYYDHENSTSKKVSKGKCIISTKFSPGTLMPTGYWTEGSKSFGHWTKVGILVLWKTMTQKESFIMWSMMTVMKNGLTCDMRDSSSCYFLVRFLVRLTGKKWKWEINVLMMKMKKESAKKEKERKTCLWRTTTA